jgi:hypothetical protein
MRPYKKQSRSDNAIQLTQSQIENSPKHSFDWKIKLVMVLFSVILATNLMPKIASADDELNNANTVSGVTEAGSENSLANEPNANIESGTSVTQAEPETGSRSDYESDSTTGDSSDGELPEDENNTQDGDVEPDNSDHDSTTIQDPTKDQDETDEDLSATEVEQLEESEEVYHQYYVNPPTMPGSSGISLLELSGAPPASIIVQVTLNPPDLGYSIVGNHYGYHSVEWLDVAEHGFTSKRNSVAISSGYTGNDWLYGVTGNDEFNAEFAANSTVHCIDPGKTAPFPGGDNTRDIVMGYYGETHIDNQPYCLYWGSSTFNYDPSFDYNGGAGPQRMGLFVAIPRSFDVTLLKRDVDTQQPVADTEFTLLKYPVSFQNGAITTDTTSITADDPAWLDQGRLTTNTSGLVTFSSLSYGYYQLIESRPNPLYMSYEESGGTARFVKIDRYSTPELQVFEDELIYIGVEVYKNTISLTSAAFSTSKTDSTNINNTGAELYHYDLYFRSTSNVRVDELTIVDPLENASSGQVRVIEVYTPVVFGDSDGYFNLWYQTNRTDSSTKYSEESALSSNPHNPNNPGQTQVWPSTGWQLWRAKLPTTSSVALKVADLGLAEGEYISALRYEYGSVERGFTNLNGGLSTTQSNKSSKPAAINWEPQPSDRFYSAAAASAAGLKPATYMVACPEAMLPPSTISSSVYANIARNYVLTDYDFDDVQTQVIEPFELAVKPYEPNEGKTASHTSPVIHVPHTGDLLGQQLWVNCAMALVVGGFMLVSSRRPGRATSRRLEDRSEEKKDD